MRWDDMSRVLELFGLPTHSVYLDWAEVVQNQECPFLNRPCVKARKSQPDVAIGTCVVSHGRGRQPLVICPHRLIQNSTVFVDCIHLLARHRPGNQFHLLPEMRIPGGSVDYFLVSARNRKVDDFVAVELQSLDTTGTVWPERQRFIRGEGVNTDDSDHLSGKRFGINWKMTAKTILVQLHHKVESLEYINKHLVLVIQDSFLKYMRSEFVFDHVQAASPSDTLQFHGYEFGVTSSDNPLQLVERLSTDAKGVEKCLGLQAQTNIEMNDILSAIERRLSDDTVLNVFP